MFKVLIFAKRAPGLTREQFIEKYEGVHIPLATKLIGDGTLPPMNLYKRNYIQHDGKFNTGTVDFDVVTEARFDSEAMFEENRRGVETPGIGDVIHKDLAELLDLSTMRYIVVDEYSGGGGAPDNI